MLGSGLKQLKRVSGVAASIRRTASTNRPPFALNTSGANNGTVATIFGASGFLGRYVAESIVTEMGIYLVSPFRTEAKSVDHLGVLGVVGQVAPLRYDLRDKETVLKATEHSEVVINMVGRAWETRNFKYHDVHVNGARTIAEAAKQNGAQRFIHFSAVGADINSKSDFLRTKAEGELAVREVFPDAIILRLAPVFGVEDNILNKWGLRCAQARLRVLLPMNARFQPVYALDVADAVKSVLYDQSTIGKTFQLGGPQIWTVQSLIDDLILPQLGSDPKVEIFPYEKAKKWAYWMEFMKHPEYLLSEVESYQKDLVVDEGSLGLSDLGIKPTTIKSVASVILKPYKAIVKKTQ